MDGPVVVFSSCVTSLAGCVASPTQEGTQAVATMPRATREPTSEVGVWLAARGLEAYEHSFVRLGYHRLVLLRGMDEEEENDLITAHSMLRPHERALRSALRELRYAARGAHMASVNSGSATELGTPLLVAAEPV
eukprot:COSAG05_NODE_5906_length_1062_cov_1.095535_2_plen_134_part_01